MPLVTISLLIIFLIIYIGSVVWIFRDSRKRQDELTVVWCILALISFPIVLIIYIMVTHINNENYTCSSCNFKVRGNWKFCPNCKQELKNDLKENAYENMNNEINIRKPIGALPIAIFVAGIVLFALFLSFSLININNSFTKVTVPGTTTINLKDKGEYTVFYEYKNDGDASEIYSQVKNMDITITDINNENKIATSDNPLNSNYSFGGTSGSAFLKFNVEAPGNYQISGNSKAGYGSKVTISIAQNFMGNILFTVLGSLVIMFGAIIGGIYIIIRRSKKA